MSVSLSKYRVGDDVEDNLYGNEVEYGRIVGDLTNLSGRARYSVYWGFNGGEPEYSVETPVTLDEMARG